MMSKTEVKSIILAIITALIGAGASIMHIINVNFTPCFRAEMTVVFLILAGIIFGVGLCQIDKQEAENEQ